MVYNVLKFKSYLENLEIKDYKDHKLEKEAFSEKKHKKKVLFIDDQIEMVLIIWPGNYQTGIHSHPEGGCISKCLENTLIENRYDTENVNLIDSKKQQKNSISYIDNKLYYHKIINNTSEVAYSIHIYSPPNYYNKNRNIFI